MTLEFVVSAFQHPGGTVAIQRFFVDMPITPKKVCMIRKVEVNQIELSRVATAFDTFWAMSVDPDHVLRSMIQLDSTIFVSGHWEAIIITAISFVAEGGEPWTYDFPEGIPCPYTRLPFFVQNSNANAGLTNYTVKVFFEFISMTPQQLAIAVLRRGRGVTRD